MRDHLRALWNALCWIGEDGDECPAFRLTEDGGQSIHTRWALGLRYELLDFVRFLRTGRA